LYFLVSLKPGEPFFTPHFEELFLRWREPIIPPRIVKYITKFPSDPGLIFSIGGKQPILPTSSFREPLANE
jgi:hypothetical protein